MKDHEAEHNTLARDLTHDIAGGTHTKTLGSLRLRNVDTNERILIPTPSADPNDPLNRTTFFKYYTAIAVCFAMVMCNFLAAGPTIAVVETAMDFFPNWKQMGLVAAIQKTVYFFNTTALFQGIGNLVWMPLINKYGRRPIYVISFTIYFVTALWCAFAHQYANFLVARIIMGLAAGAGECLAPLTIADIFFLHERGFVMSIYTAALNLGVGFGLIIDGLITINHPWRVIYYVAAALIGFLVVMVVLTFPETAYNRSAHPEGISTTLHHVSAAYGHTNSDEAPGEVGTETGDKAVDRSVYYRETAEVRAHPAKRTWTQELPLFRGTFTEESLLAMTLRPLGLLILPPVLWATLVQSVTIGFITAVTSNVASAFSTTYGFEAWQSGLCFFSAIIGACLGIIFGGMTSDRVADFFTRRNGGIREPEMRLPSIMISCITSPLSLILYGVGIQNKLHWMCPTVGIGLLNFSITQACNVSLVYIIDAYRPIAGEAIITQLAFKSCFGFLLGFYTNTWVAESGYAAAYGEMAAISGGVLLMWIPLYIWGKRIRIATLNWGIMKYVRWDEDREVGE
ncbi:major facilitator superfamily domain-containing protein [Exophiala viscosa]|uniref:Major facilitator superfamily domain-containing protein n=1 Tax=Exophiala viscosa TaxID=2486360 RepID=A0AAN6E1H3_9EURO|nr:major facilitator superfamily domain-containing protein [Exophiala viscosa]